MWFHPLFLLGIIDQFSPLSTVLGAKEGIMEVISIGLFYSAGIGALMFEQ